MAFFGLPPDRRLRRREEFQHVFEQGRRVHGRYITVVAAPSTQSCDRLGIVASRKLGGAVTRNRAKRLIRNIFRTTIGCPRTGGAPLDLVFIPKRGMTDATRAALEQDVRGALARLDVKPLIGRSNS